MWLSVSLSLTIESWKVFTTADTAIASAAPQMHGLMTLFTSAESLKNILNTGRYKIICISSNIFNAKFTIANNLF
jgi:hypothetical protein